MQSAWKMSYSAGPKGYTKNCVFLCTWVKFEILFRCLLGLCINLPLLILHFKVRSPFPEKSLKSDCWLKINTNFRKLFCPTYPPPQKKAPPYQALAAIKSHSRSQRPFDAKLVPLSKQHSYLHNVKHIDCILALICLVFLKRVLGLRAIGSHE